MLSLTKHRTEKLQQSDNFMTITVRFRIWDKPLLREMEKERSFPGDEGWYPTGGGRSLPAAAGDD